MPLIDDLDAARIVLDLIKDRDVSIVGPYNNADKISPALGAKYIEPIYRMHPKVRPKVGITDIPWESMTNQQKAEMFFRFMRLILVETRAAWQKDLLGYQPGESAYGSAISEGNVDL